MKMKTVNVLLVEDDDVDAMGVKRAFRKNKIANPLFHAVDGVEALEMLRGENGHDKIQLPCMLLIDINMPRMNGIELLEEIRKDEILRTCIAFVLTTSKRDADIFAAYNLNVAGYTLKQKVGDDFMNMIVMLGAYWRIIEFPDS